MTFNRLAPLIGLLSAVLLLTGCADDYGRHDRQDRGGHGHGHGAPSHDQDHHDGPPR